MKPNTHRFGQAVIIGGSIAGLMSARVLADHFDKVLVLEREPFPEGPEARKSTPQGRHIHAVLEAGLKTMEGLFPGLRRELEAGGVEYIDMARDAAWLQSGSWKARYEGDIETILVSRPFLEWKLRGHVAALPNVELRTGYCVEELVLDASRTRAVGVKVKGPEGEQEIPGALIVDASGRGSRAPQWLEALGFGQVEQEQVRIDLGYTSRLYERPPGFDAWKILVLNGKAPESQRSGFISNVEGGRWIVSLNGYFGDHAPTDDAGFLEFARGLPTPAIYEYIRDARPLTDPVLHKIPSSRWLHYERLARRPEGFVLLGDAVCALNPVFGQGMTVSALGAKFLGECVARAKASPEGLPLEVARPFQKKLAGLIGLCWTLTTTMDLAHPRAEGKRPFGLKFLQWSFQNMIDLTSQHAASCRTFYEALHLRKGIMGLLQPGFLGALMVYNLKSFFVPRHKRANLDRMPARPGPSPRPGLGRVDVAA
ncbi:hypothetical protein D187_000307 [Cystobacter fuscus DSM 2262]|uniref:FAD-binding domain-containing protein n=1 Tax=Cystobacter fuscus (strain ATCC 25194 / DSM 2262 / NBRC 100088 / M29) TaxID=1242864 RepID=S9PKU3_CYSF2|nr:hypothetical protein [Cystobacter fuscus]EPX64885.1 hypothetical protein D187_000307 [Cystobacter fuscus DSM 2262]